jgi:hypothetical protein
MDFVHIRYASGARKTGRPRNKPFYGVCRCPEQQGFQPIVKQRLSAALSALSELSSNFTVWSEAMRLEGISTFLEQRH